MDTTTDFIISGFKHFKAIKKSTTKWEVYSRLTKSHDRIGIIIYAYKWSMELERFEFDAEQFLDLAGLIKSVSRFNAPKIKTPLDDRLSLYQIMKDTWNQFYNDDTSTQSGIMREGYRHSKSGIQLYVAYRLKNGDIEEMDFYRTSNFIGKLSIKLVRMELNFIKKLTNTQ